MAILLKDHISLSESIRYKPPFVNVTKKGADDDITRSAARKLFYDFYAMEYLHRTLGSQYTDVSPEKKTASQLSALKGQFYNFYGDDPHLASLKETEKEKDTSDSKSSKKDQVKKDISLSMMGVAGAANWGDIDEPMSGIILPHKFRTIIDDVYDQVTTIMAQKLLAHLRLTIIQEFRYFTSKTDFAGFRMSLVSLYNIKKQTNSKVTQDEIKTLIERDIPNMENNMESVKKLLLYSRYYSKLAGLDGKDPSQDVEKDDDEDKKSYHDIDTDPNAVDISKDKSDVEVPDGEEIPDYPDYEYPSGEFDPEDPFDKKKKLDEYLSGVMDPKSILKVKTAINKAKLSWDDIVLGFKNVGWSGGYGGKKWGEGTEAFLKLKEATEKHDTEQMAGHIDHIFDLQHNTGALLNKGGMFVSSEDLDKRAKISSVLCYLDEVSPSIKAIIKNTIRYTSSTPELDVSIDDYISKPVKHFTDEETKKLLSYGLIRDESPDGDSSQFKGNAPYANKDGHNIQRFYIIRAHQNGLYSLHDTKKTDKRLFKTFDELDKYVSTFVYPNLVKPESQRIKLPADKEAQLLSICKMGWRDGSKRYKAYLPNNDRCYLMAFDDGSFEVHNAIAAGKLKTTNWEDALNFAKNRTLNAQPYPGSVAQNVNVTSPQSTPASSTHSSGLVYTSSDLVKAFKDYGFKVLHDKAQKHISYNGAPAYIVTIIMNNGGTEVVHYSPEIQVFSYAAGGKSSKQLSDVIDYLMKLDNYKKSSTISIPLAPPAFTTQTPGMHSGGSSTLPPNSNSKASYKVHVGINKPPTNSIRLTTEDENILKSIGFNPKLISGQVWYIHSGCSDAVQFFPNNTAKVKFATASVHTGALGIKYDIDTMLQWLPTKYTIDSKKSPLVTTVQKPTGIPQTPAWQTPTSGTKGIKLLPVIEKKLNDAGFVWDSSAGQYMDGQNSINVNKDQSSILNISGGPVKTFTKILDLLSYISKEYPAQKKIYNSSAVTKDPETSVIPAEKLAEISNLLSDKGFIYSGPGMPNSGADFTYKKGDASIFIGVDGKSTCYDKDINEKGYVTFETIDELSGWLTNFYDGLSDNNNSDEDELPPKSNSINNITQEEITYVKNIVEKLGWLTKVEPTYDHQAFLIVIQTEKGLPFYDFYKQNNYYNISLKGYHPLNLWASVGFKDTIAKLKSLIEEQNSFNKPKSDDSFEKDEVSMIKDQVSQYPNIELKEKLYDIVIGNDKKQKILHLEILNKLDGNTLATMRKFNGLYGFWKVIDNTWDVIYNGDSWETLYNKVNEWLKNDGGGTEPKFPETPLPSFPTSPESQPSTDLPSPSPSSPTNEQIVNEILDGLSGIGWYNKNTMGTNPYEKVPAIKWIRVYINDIIYKEIYPNLEGGSKEGIPLADAKWIIEHFDQFMKYVSKQGLKYGLTINGNKYNIDIVDVIKKYLANLKYTPEYNSQLVVELKTYMSANAKGYPDLMADKGNLISNIKLLRDFYYQKTGLSGSILHTRRAIENFDKFLSYVYNHGFPDMTTSDESDVNKWLYSDQPDIADDTEKKLKEIGYRYTGDSVNVDGETAEYSNDEGDSLSIDENGTVSWYVKLKNGELSFTGEFECVDDFIKDYKEHEKEKEKEQGNKFWTPEKIEDKLTELGFKKIGVDSIGGLVFEYADGNMIYRVCVYPLTIEYIKFIHTDQSGSKKIHSWIQGTDAGMNDLSKMFSNASSDPDQGSKVWTSEKIKDKLIELGFEQSPSLYNPSVFNIQDGMNINQVIVSVGEIKYKYYVYDKETKKYKTRGWTKPVDEAMEHLIKMFSSPSPSDPNQEKVDENSSLLDSKNYPNPNEFYNPDSGGYKPGIKMKLRIKDHQAVLSKGFEYGLDPEEENEYHHLNGDWFYIKSNGTMAYAFGSWNSTTTIEEGFARLKGIYFKDSKTSSPAEKTKTGDMPFSGFDYKKWAIENSILSYASSFINKYDEEVLMSIGFYPNPDPNENDPAFLIPYTKGNEKMYFFPYSNQAAYWNGNNGPKYFSIKNGMKFLWDKHSSFIEEHKTYKLFMKQWLQ